MSCALVFAAQKKKNGHSDRSDAAFLPRSLVRTSRVAQWRNPSSLSLDFVFFVSVFSPDVVNHLITVGKIRTARTA